ncbi:MAG: ABC transporter substrate-binding protein [Acidimicrobiia bacterium]|nr:ABC transporter substrate-binding protein [Acidimicrobiia bacterium]
MHRTSVRRKWLPTTAIALVLILFAAACGGGDDDDATGGGGGDDDTTETTASGEPQAGGRVVYGLEAESSNGLCLAEAQLAISGIQIARAIYDPLTMPNGDGEYVPYLAKSVTPNAGYDEWTIELREGVKFHDGSDLTAEVVKNNLDAFRGQYEARKPLLFLFVYDNIDTVEATGPLTVVVTTKSPWPSFPAYLFMNGRFGVMAQSQLDDPDHCGDDLVGTGPFSLVDWKINDHLTVEKNADYWQEGLPYLDEIEFRPITEAQQRLNALQSGEITAMHTSTASTIDELRRLVDSGDVALTEGAEYAEVGYAMLNMAKAPFDNINARLAFAHALDRDTLNEVRNKGILTNASGPFAPGSIGYLEDAGFPEFDVEKAKEYVAKYEEESGGKLSFAYSTTPTPDSDRVGDDAPADGRGGRWVDGDQDRRTGAAHQRRDRRQLRRSRLPSAPRRRPRPAVRVVALGIACELRQVLRPGDRPAAGGGAGRGGPGEGRRYLRGPQPALRRAGVQPLVPVDPLGRRHRARRARGSGSRPSRRLGAVPRSRRRTQPRRPLGRRVGGSSDSGPFRGVDGRSAGAGTGRLRRR